MPFSRRKLLKIGVAASGALVCPAIILARASEVLAVAGYGGEFQDIFLRTIAAPFEKKFSCKVVYDSAGNHMQNYAKIRASRGSPGFDVAAEMSAGQNILGGKEKLLERITEKEVPNIKHQWAKSASLIPGNGIVSYYQYLAIIWNKDKIAQPKSWLDYWEAHNSYGDAIKGHILAHGIVNFELAAYALLMAAKSRGGDERRMDEAWKLMRAQKPYLGPVVDSSAAAAPYLENQQAWIGPYWSARAIYYIKRGFPIGVTIPKEGTVSIASTSSVPIGAKNKRLAYEFLNFRLEPEIQYAFCTEYNCSPGRSDLKDWPPEFIEQQVTTEERLNSLTFPDLDYLASQVRAWTEKWQEIMAT